MKRLSMGGFTAAGVLVVAVLGGVVGGAVAMGGQDPAVPAAPVQVQSVADEATSTPTPTATPTAEPEPERVDEPVSDPAPIVEPVAPKGETAQQAADRAKAEADRAKLEADRAAEKAAETKPAAPAPAPAPPVMPAEDPDSDTLPGTSTGGGPVLDGLKPATPRPTPKAVDRGM